MVGHAALARPMRAIGQVVIHTLKLLPAIGLLGCETSSLSSPSSAEPFLFVVISPEPLPRRFTSASDSAIHALLLTTGSASGAPFRTAERFEVTSTADGRTFTFLERPLGAPVPGIGRQGASLDDGNYVLPFAPSPDSNSASEFRHLITYDLRVETDGRQILGRVLIPERPRPEIFVDGDKRFVVIPNVAGAAAYLVSGDTESSERLVRNGMIQLFYDRNPASVPPNPEFRVIALDSNVVRYISDSTLARSGVDGAYGLFGAASSARIPVPWP